MDFDSTMAIVKQVMVPMFYKESLIGFSIENNVKPFKKELFKTILNLAKKADNETLKNQDIRDAIKKIAQKTGASVGQTQKVINVYLKYYCILRGLGSVISELDCPIDNGVVKLVWSRFTEDEKDEIGNQLGLDKKGISLNYLFFSEIARLHSMWFGLYELIQSKIEEVSKGNRILPDIEAYDKKRIRNFLLSE